MFQLKRVFCVVVAVILSISIVLSALPASLRNNFPILRIDDGSPPPQSFGGEPFLPSHESRESTKIVGYTDRFSYRHGERISLFLSLHENPTDGGGVSMKECHISSKHSSFELKFNAVKIIKFRGCASSDGCGFERAFTFTVPPHVPFGMYGFLCEAFRKEIVFNVKPNTEEFQELRNATGVIVPTMTFLAYNKNGGSNFYRPLTSMVSFHRPMLDDSHGHGILSAFVDLVSVAKDTTKSEVILIDSFDIFEESGIILGNLDLLIIPFHAEYETEKYYKEIEKFVKSGKSMFILGGNTWWWQVEVVNGSSIFLDKSVSRHINKLESLGLLWSYAKYPVRRYYSAKTFSLKYPNSSVSFEDISSYHVNNATHPIFAGQNKSNGDKFGFSDDHSLLWLEMDGIPITMSDNGRWTQNAWKDTVALSAAHSITDHSIIATYFAVGGADEYPFRHMGGIIDMKLGKGRVLNFGSCGSIFAATCPKVGCRYGDDSIQILKNAIMYLHRSATGN